MTAALLGNQTARPETDRFSAAAVVLTFGERLSEVTTQSEGQSFLLWGRTRILGISESEANNELETALVGDLHGPKLMTLAVATYMCRPEAAVGGFTLLLLGGQSSHELVQASTAVLDFVCACMFRIWECDTTVTCHIRRSRVTHG